MEDFKLEMFGKENPGRVFPEHRRLPPDTARPLRTALARKSRSGPVEGAALLKVLFEGSRPVEGVHADSDGFDLVEVARSLGLDPREEVYVNWDDFATIDRVRFGDLAEHFPYFWYPGPDDIEIFDDSLSWVLFVDHSGYLRVWVPDDR